MIAVIIVWLVFIYLIAGAVFAIAFLLRGIYVVDETAKGGSIGFKLIITPGVIVLWPVLLFKWRQMRNTKMLLPAEE